jgi:hypothetical protein
MVMGRRTRQMIAFVIGDWSEATCRRLWSGIPQPYRQCYSFSDFGKAYLRCFLKQPISKSTKTPGWLLTWNAGITPCANGWHAIPAKRLPFSGLILPCVGDPMVHY